MDLNALNQAFLQSQQAIAFFTAVMAIGTLILAALAIAGVPIRDFILRPNLTVHLNNQRGELVQWNNGQFAIYYHLKVENHGRSTARNAQVLCVKTTKKRVDGTFYPEPMAAPERLSWRFANLFGITRDIPAGSLGRIGEICDLGFVNEGSLRFQLAPYAATVSFPGFVSARESMQVSLVVGAENFSPKESCSVEISWDGQWSKDLNEMQKHLIVKEITTDKA